MTRSRAAVLLAALGVAVPFVAGCGGGSSSTASNDTTSSTTTSSMTITTSTESTASATTWVDGFCGAFKDWSHTLTPIAQNLKSNPTKDNLQSAGNDIRDANKTLANDLKSLGKPEIPGGDEAKTAVNTLADQISADSDTISNALSNISSASELVAAAGAVSTTLVQLQTQVNETLSKLKAIDASNGSLKDALKNSSTCKSLSAGS